MTSTQPCSTCPQPAVYRISRTNDSGTLSCWACEDHVTAGEFHLMQVPLPGSKLTVTDLRRATVDEVGGR